MLLIIVARYATLPPVFRSLMLWKCLSSGICRYEIFDKFEAEAYSLVSGLQGLFVALYSALADCSQAYLTLFSLSCRESNLSWVAHSNLIGFVMSLTSRALALG